MHEDAELAAGAFSSDHSLATIVGKHQYGRRMFARPGTRFLHPNDCASVMACVRLASPYCDT